MRNLLIFTTILLSTSILVGCAKKHRIEITDSVTTETSTPKGYRVQTIRRIPGGAMIRITDLEKVELGDDKPLMGALVSPVPAIGRRAGHNIGIGKTLAASDIWWEPRSAYAQSDLVQNDIKLAKARWHEKEDLQAEEEFKNGLNQGVGPASDASLSTDAATTESNTTTTTTTESTTSTTESAK